MSIAKTPAKGEGTTVARLSQFITEQPANGPEAEETVSAVVRQAVDEVCQSASETVIAPKGGPITRKGLLGILTYCYAKRVYASEEIHDELDDSTTIVVACNNKVPDAFSLRRFRRSNRLILQACLERALRRSPRHVVLLPGSSAANTEGNTTVIHREAEERLDKAAFVDRMSLDD